MTQPQVISHNQGQSCSISNECVLERDVNKSNFLKIFKAPGKQTVKGSLYVFKTVTSLIYLVNPYYYIWCFLKEENPPLLTGTANNTEDSVP